MGKRRTVFDRLSRWDKFGVIAFRVGSLLTICFAGMMLARGDTAKFTAALLTTFFLRWEAQQILSPVSPPAAGDAREII